MTPDKNGALRARLRELAEIRRRFGSPGLTVLLRREGWLVNGRRLRLLTMVDGWDRSCPHIEVDHSLTGERVVRVLERLKQQGLLPDVL